MNTNRTTKLDRERFDKKCSVAVFLLSPLRHVLYAVVKGGAEIRGADDDEEASINLFQNK